MERYLKPNIDSIIQELKSLKQDQILQDNVFDIALVMAGAVSAGAYTAGVIDFLLEALDSWEKKKKQEESLPEKDRTVPYHKVRIRVLTGASAGGMTAGMFAKVIEQVSVGNREINKRVKSPDIKPEDKSPIERTWVDEIDISKLLNMTDLGKDSPGIRSLLDSTPIDEIADGELISKDHGKPWTKRPEYIHKKLKLFLTLTNLRGIPYEFDLEGLTGFSFGMREHADYLYKEINETLDEGDWEEIKESAKATGAFPVGLSARLIHRDPEYYSTRFNKDNKDYSPFLKIREKFESYSFVAVDGGVLNNEPLELARAALYAPKDKTVVEQKIQADKELRVEKLLEEGLMIINKLEDKDKKDSYSKELVKAYADVNINKAIILIDPFPNRLEYKENPTPKNLALTKIILPLISAIRGQALFKPRELIFTAHKNVFNRFMIAPVRKRKDKKRADNAIACGFFGGFGGFFDQKFRQHDYWLGRFNCQAFLKKYFVIPENDFVDNIILQGNNRQIMGSNDRYYEKDLKTDEKYFSVIPLMKELEDEKNRLDPWPEYSRKDYKTTLNKLSKRLSRLCLKLFNKELKMNLVALLVFLLLAAIAIVGIFLDCGWANIKCLCKSHVHETEWWCITIARTELFLFQLILYLAIIVSGFIAFFPPLLKGFLMKKLKKLIRGMLEEHDISLK
ncbi:patatin-like phospholipase family protein [Bacteroidota bacterium]